MKNVGIKNSEAILSEVNKTLEEGCPVILTDGTVSMKIEDINISDGSDGILCIKYRMTSGIRVWATISLDEFSMTTIEGDIYIAPDWWVNGPGA